MKTVSSGKARTILFQILTRPRYYWPIAVVVYLLASFSVMGGVLVNCYDTVLGYPGDGTGGLAWFQWAEGHRFLWGFTELSNYPFGEDLQRPQFITAILLFLPYQFFSILTNELCGLNIMTLLGFMSTALVGFGFVRYLTDRTGISLFAGYAIGFTPFAYYQAQGHLSYVYSSVFVALLWTFIYFYRKPSYKAAILIGVSYAASFYMDGYFILLSTAFLAIFILFVAWSKLIKLTVRNRQLSIEISPLKNSLLVLKKLCVTVITTLVLLMPIILMQVTSGDRIADELGSARSDSNIKTETMVWGARISDYLLPSSHTVFSTQEYRDWRSDTRASNVFESTLYIGYGIIALAAVAVYFVLKGGGKSIRKTDRGLLRPLVIFSIVSIVILSLLALPPYYSVFGVEIATPTSVLISLTEKWRVLARFYMIIHILWVVLAAVGLYILSQRISRRAFYWVLGVSLVILAIEFIPVGNYIWSKSRDTPAVYSQIKEDKSVKAIAEYPIVDFPSRYLPYSFTYQQTHAKPLLNSNSATTNQRYLRQSIAGIGDTQTLGVLRQLGIDTITTFNIDANSVDGLTKYTEPAKNTDPLIERVYSYKINEDVERRPLALVARHGFTFKTKPESLRSVLSIQNIAVMTIDPVGKDVVKAGSIYRAAFIATAYGDNIQKVVVKQNDKIIWSGAVSKETQIEFDATVNDPIFVNIDGNYNTPSIEMSNLSVQR